MSMGSMKRNIVVKKNSNHFSWALQCIGVKYNKISTYQFYGWKNLEILHDLNCENWPRDEPNWLSLFSFCLKQEYDFSVI